MLVCFSGVWYFCYNLQRCRLCSVSYSAGQVNKHSYKQRIDVSGNKQEEKILNEPAAMYRSNKIVIVILSGL